mgnify:CR=1 FL=1
MFTHINQTNGYLCHIDGSFRYRFRRPDDGNNGTIVVRVAGIIQDLQPGNLAGFINNLSTFALSRPSLKFGTNSTNFLAI